MGHAASRLQGQGGGLPIQFTLNREQEKTKRGGFPMHVFHVHYSAVVVAAAIQWLFGWLWYGVAFKKRWTQLLGFSEPGKPSSAALAMIASFVASLVLCFVLANLIMMAGTGAFMGGLALAVICWLGFMAPPMFAQHIYERRPANLFAINAAYWMVAMAFAGGVLAAWKQ